ncbi:helix-turn-helix domain-containing protein [Nocardia sp. NBC_00511]|uniref:helix-turn-helix domain-containing protein n=1 Tax=Nocardia sp. NBC_00511 TaxID=2903591 RepID=UPI0030E57A18
MAGSSLPRRAFGRTLRRYRERVGKSQLAAGLAAEISPQGISRLEEGYKIRIATSQIKDLLDLYEVSGSEREEVLSLWREVKDQDLVAKAAGIESSWWRSYSDQYAPHFDHYLALEEVATHLTTLQMVLLPGLLQTQEYRRTMIRIASPDLSAVDVERGVELAMRRRTRLENNEFRIDVLLWEPTICGRSGGGTIMADQLRYLVEVSERPNVSIRVVPLDVVGHLGLIVQTFTLLEFPASSIGRTVEPPIVYVEGYEGALFHERDEVIARHRRAISDIQGLALSEEDTRLLVTSRAKEYAA